MIYDVKHLQDTIRYQRAFVVVDLIYLNDVSYTERPLYERLQVLNSNVFKETDPQTVSIAKQTEVSKVYVFFCPYI